MRISVTFDTNTFRPVVEPHKRSAEQEAAFGIIEKAIQNGTVEPYLSDTIVHLEGVRKSDRADYWKSVKPEITSTTHHSTSDQNGMVTSHIHTTLRPIPANPAVIPNQLTEALQSAISMGFKFIKTCRIGFPQVESNLYKIISEEEFVIKHERCNHAINEFEKRGFGGAHASAIADASTEKDPSLSQKGLLAFAFGDEKKVASALAEWSDGDALAAHYGHQHDYFCTSDVGSSAGPKSVLHKSHRTWLKEQFALELVNPSELADILTDIQANNLER